MKTTETRESAKVYAFPARGRAGLTTAAKQPLSDWDIEVLNLPPTAFGSSWYHDAAIVEADRIGKL